MAYIGSSDWLAEVAKGNVAGHSIIHKFGEYGAIPTTYTPVARLGIYQTVQSGSAVTLRIKAGGNANDTAAGSGAREITLEGIDENGDVATETLATAGASASSYTTTTFMRLYRAYVSASGTYATSSAGSHSGTITFEDSNANDWADIEANGYALSQTEIGVYTIPTGFTGYLISSHGFSESSKVTTLIFFKRENILETAAPYTAMRVMFEERVEGGEFRFTPRAPILIGTACDCGFMAKVNQNTADVEVDFEILLIDNNYL